MYLYAQEVTHNKNCIAFYTHVVCECRQMDSKNRLQNTQIITSVKGKLGQVQLPQYAPPGLKCIWNVKFFSPPVCPYIVNKQQEKCVKWTHWSDLDDDVGKKSNTSGILKFFMVVGTHLCKMATLLCHPSLSRPFNVSRQIGGNHEIPLVFVSLGSSQL